MRLISRSPDRLSGRRWLKWLASVALFTVMAPLTAQACSMAGQLPIVKGIKTGDYAAPGHGVYEQKTIARAPSLGLRTAVTASIVTRYWGAPPGDVGVQIEGGRWLPPRELIFGRSGQCPDPMFPDGPAGTIGYGLVTPLDNDEARLAPNWFLSNPEIRDSLTPKESKALEAAFGPPTLVEVSSLHVVGATIAVWWPVVLVFAALMGTGVLVVVLCVSRFRARWTRRVGDETPASTLPSAS